MGIFDGGDVILWISPNGELIHDSDAESHRDLLLRAEEDILQETPSLKGAYTKYYKAVRKYDDFDEYFEELDEEARKVETELMKSGWIHFETEDGFNLSDFSLECNRNDRKTWDAIWDLAVIAKKEGKGESTVTCFLGSRRQTSLSFNNIVKDTLEEAVQTRGVLAGAYKNKRLDRLLTHSVGDDGEPLCGTVLADSICDYHPNPSEAPTCQKCLKRDSRFKNESFRQLVESV